MPVSLAAILVILVLAAEPAIAGIACNDRGCRVVRSDCQVISLQRWSELATRRRQAPAKPATKVRSVDFST